MGRIIIWGVVFLLFGAPMIAIMGLQIFGQAMFFSASQDIHQSISKSASRNDPMDGNVLDIINHKKRGRFKRSYVAFSRMNDIESNRSISFTAYVTPKSLLASGENLPDRSLMEIFAKSHALGFSRKECERLLTVLASRCKVESSRARLGKDGLIRIDTWLKFVQKMPFGSYEENEKLAYQEIGKSLTLKNKPVVVPMRAAAAQRMRFYQKILRECNSIRKSAGNCVLYKISIKAHKKSHSRSTRMAGTVWYTYIQKIKG